MSIWADFFPLSPFLSRLYPKAYPVHCFDDRAERVDLVARLPCLLPHARDSTTHAHFKQSLTSAFHLSALTDPGTIEPNRKVPQSRLTGSYLRRTPSYSLSNRLLSRSNANRPVVTSKLATDRLRPPRSTGCDLHRNSHGDKHDNEELPFQLLIGLVITMNIPSATPTAYFLIASQPRNCLVQTRASAPLRLALMLVATVYDAVQRSSPLARLDPAVPLYTRPHISSPLSIRYRIKSVLKNFL